MISGGCGFIGSRLAARYVERGDRVRVLDNFHPQVHIDRSVGEKLRSIGVDLIEGDCRDRRSWDRALEGAELVLHMAAETGTGQSMTEVARYCDVNVMGTAMLAEALLTNRSVRSIFLPSSRAVYGEGQWLCTRDGAVTPYARRRKDLSQGVFDPICPLCCVGVTPIATREDAVLRPASIYASTKLMQEHVLTQTCAAIGKTLLVARYQNVYGPGQALNNPYTGVLAIFAKQLSLGKRLNLYEDGKIVRDFVFIDDVVDATIAIADSATVNSPINVGSGMPTTLFDVVDALGGTELGTAAYDVTGEFRDGDIRHAVADVTSLRQVWGGSPRSFRSGLSQYIETIWDQLVA